MFRLNYKTFMLLPAALLCIIAPFIHRAGFTGTQYFSEEAFWFPIIAAGIAAAVSFFTGRYGSLLTFLASFASLLSFVNVSYLYLSSVFFNGMAGTLGGMLEQIGFYWSFCLFAYLVAMLIGIVAMFLPDGNSF